MHLNHISKNYEHLLENTILNICYDILISQIRIRCKYLREY